LPQAHQTLLSDPVISFLNNLSAIDDAIDDNADLADAILELGLETFGLDKQPEKGSVMDWHDTARPLDLNKAHSTIKQFWRDWSKEGFEAEVRPILNLIISDLASNLNAGAHQTRVLLPGAGLGRLLFELCLAGYLVEGNEISYHQLLASNFILNTTERATQYKLYPFVGSFNNHVNRQNQLHMVEIPDIHPGTTIEEGLGAEQSIGEMNMSAGDFITSYSSSDHASSFDAVVTVYFIDTAPNVIRYMETIQHCLTSGGLWINIGPLLWHFEDRMSDKHDIREEHDHDHDGDGNIEETREQTGIAEPGSFELTDEEVLVLAQRVGFEVVSHESLPPSVGGYIQDPASMLQNRYQCSHWVLRKRNGQ
jgi:carnosine N-methyltransferase